MKTKAIMTMAWKLARHGAKKFGGSVKLYFAAALKAAWKSYKESLVKKGSDIMGMAEWWIEKNFGKQFVGLFNGLSKLEIVKQTEKAYYIKQTQLDAPIKVTNEFWVPKSVCY